MTKQELIEKRNWYQKLLLAMIEIYHKLPQKLKKEYDIMIKDYTEELKELSRIISERI
jgi:hypothetical protein